MSKVDPDEVHLDQCSFCLDDVYSGDEYLECTTADCGKYCHSGCWEGGLHFTCLACTTKSEKKSKKKSKKKIKKKKDDDDDSYKENENLDNRENENDSDDDYNPTDYEPENRPTSALSALSATTTTSNNSLGSTFKRVKAAAKSKLKRPSTAKSDQSPNTGRRGKKSSKKLAKIGNEIVAAVEAAKSAAHSFSNRLSGKKGPQLYSGNNEVWKKYHKNIIVSDDSLSSEELEKKFKPKKSAQSYVPHPDATDELNQEAEEHYIYQALAGPDSPLSGTGYVDYGGTTYYKRGNRHAEALKIALVKKKINDRNAVKKKRESREQLGISESEYRALRREEIEELRSIEVTAPDDIAGSTGPMIEFILSTLFNDESVAVQVFGSLFPYLLTEQDRSSKFTRDEAGLSLDNYIQKHELLSSIGGNDHDCVRMRNERAATSTLAEILQDVAMSQFSEDVLTGSVPRNKDSFRPQWYTVTLLSRIADIYSSIAQPLKFFELLRELPTGEVTGRSERIYCELGQICHGCNNGVTTIVGAPPCVHPDCLRFGTYEQNKMDDVFYKAILPVCNSNEYSEKMKQEYITNKILAYKMEMKSKFGREVDIVFQQSTVFENFKAKPTVATATEALKRYLPIGVPGYEFLIPTEVEDDSS